MCCYERVFYYICIPLGSDGRVARLSSAKAATAVRIRFRPHKFDRKCLINICDFFIKDRIATFHEKKGVQRICFIGYLSYLTLRPFHL